MSEATPTPNLVRQATQRLNATVDSLDTDSWVVPSLLPGWSVGHVVAHLALNAEALSAALAGVVSGIPTTMYRSNADRDTDIAALSTAAPGEVGTRLRTASDRLDTLFPLITEDLAIREIERTPGSDRRFRAGAVAWMRLREVEIHHADLGPASSSYSPAAWPMEFTTLLLDREAAHADGAGFTAIATDLGRSWVFGSPGPTVTGAASSLAWWVTGRSAYPGLAAPTSERGALPRIEGM